MKFKGSSVAVSTSSEGFQGVCAAFGVEPHLFEAPKG